MGKWELVGGKVDFGEEPEAALHREVAEESGLTVEIIRLLPEVFTHVWHTEQDEKVQVFLLTYECRVVGGEVTNGKVTDEIGALEFIPPQDIAAMDVLPNVREILKYL
jgi:8-oxo-dGTP diphosphatase